MRFEDGSYKEPVWGDEDGVITCYMCKTDFDYELGHAFSGVRAYPSEDDLRSARDCIKECGIVKVGVRQTGESPTASFIERAAFDYELGGAKGGVSLYPSKRAVFQNECYAFKYGYICVEVFLKEEIAPPNFDPSAKRIRDDRKNRIRRSDRK